ncbi:MAG: hypothetical protein AAFN77_23265 [Planctomycetota bacterium]
MAFALMIVCSMGCYPEVPADGVERPPATPSDLPDNDPSNNLQVAPPG